MLKGFWGFQWLCQYIDVLEIQFNLLFWISFCLATCLSLKKSTYIFYTKLKIYHGKVYKKSNKSLSINSVSVSLAELERALGGAALTSSHSSNRYTRPVWELEYGFLSEYFVCLFPIFHAPSPPKNWNTASNPDFYLKNGYYFKLFQKSNTKLISIAIL